MDESTVGWEVTGRSNTNKPNQTFAYLDQTIPCDGLLSKWSFWANDTDYPVALVIWRPTDNDYVLKVVGSSVMQPVEFGLNEYSFPENSQIPVEKGDVLGLAWQQPVVVYQLSKGEIGMHLWTDNGGGLLYVDGSSHEFDNSTVGSSVSLSVTVKPHEEGMCIF